MTKPRSQRPWREVLTREEIDALLATDDWRGWLSIGLDWGIVFASMALVAVWPNPLTIVVAMMSAWILFKVQIDILESNVRAITDILWGASRSVRAFTDVRRVYYSVLALSVIWGAVALTLTAPIILLQLAANIAGVVFVIGALHILRINTTLLPPALQPPLWRRVALVAMALFYGVFVWLWLMGGLVPDTSRGFLFKLFGA